MHSESAVGPPIGHLARRRHRLRMLVLSLALNPATGSPLPSGRGAQSENTPPEDPLPMPTGTQGIHLPAHPTWARAPSRHSLPSS